MSEQTLSEKLRWLREQRDQLCGTLKMLETTPMSLDESHRVISEIQFVKNDINKAAWAALLAVSQSKKVDVSEPKTITSVKEIPKAFRDQVRFVYEKDGFISAVKMVRGTYMMGMQAAADFVHTLRPKS